MNDYVIINGVNSNTISGLKISKLPPITKPQMRTLIETIDGRDGDLITDLGYSAYDKQLEIGLWGTYDINTVISFFNQEGTITFSNEADKFYNFKIINQIDYQKLLKFKTAVVVMHCQPFKYPTNETPIEGTATTITGEGESLTLNNTLEAPLEIDLKGNTYQYSTTGKNLFDKDNINGVEGGTNNDGIIQTNNNVINTVVGFSNISLPAGTYYISMDIKILSGSKTFTKINDASVNWEQVSAPTLSTTYQRYVYKYTYSSTTTLNKILVQFSNAIGACEIKDIMVSTTNSDYEPYTNGASPNPDYPQDIHVVSGDNEIKVEGKNLLPVSSLTTQTKNGITFTNNNDGSYTFNGTTSGYTTFNLFTNLSFNGIYTYVLKDTATSSFEMYIQNSNGAGIGNTTTHMTINNNIARIIIGISGNVTLNNLTITPYVYKGNYDNSTTYEPYQSASYPINLGDIELCKIGEYQDYIYKDSGKWYLHKDIGKVVLNGSENISIYNQNIAKTTFKVSGVLSSAESYSTYADTPNLLSNRFIPASQQATWVVGNMSRRTETQNDLYLVYEPNTTLEQFETWLSNNNTKVYYVLETPTNEEITDTTLLSQLNALEGARSYDNQTNINQVNNDYPFWLSVSTTFNAPITINNIGNIYAKPILELEGSGNITINLNSQDILSISLGDTTTKIVIDIPNLEAYNPTDSTLMNRLVVGDYMKLLINSGNNTLKIDGTITSYRLTSYTRWL